MSEDEWDTDKSARPAPVWERPWTVDEMKKGAGEWSLASDAGVSVISQIDTESYWLIA